MQKRGLTSSEVEESRRLHGDNIITPPRERSLWALFGEKFKDPIIRILLVAALLSLVVGIFDGEFTETVGIIVAIILATGVGFLFEWDAMRRFKRLNQVNDRVPVKVIRDGAHCEVPRCDVVVGDWVLVESGETVPADGRLVEAVQLRVNESSLTGELETAKSVVEAEFDPEATYPSNELLRGTTISDGYGLFVVTRVGDQTEAGRVTEQSTIESGEQTPLNRQLEHLSTLIGRIGLVVAVAIFVILLVKGFWLEDILSLGGLAVARYLLESFMMAVVVIVMAVPEGLPMAITLSLALSMRRMLKTNNLVRKMHACETMGAVTVICTDKTGTLTQNRMAVEEFSLIDSSQRKLLHTSIAVNTTAFLAADGSTLGNPTEGALLGWLHNEGCSYEELRGGVEILDRITFSSHLKYMATLVRLEGGGQLLCVKGAPEVVRNLSMPVAGDEELSQRLFDYQRRAMRTLAFAVRTTQAATCREALDEGPLTLLAVAAIIDPVREEVPAAVARCLGAGIDIKVVTGDTPTTATEIARRIGLWHDEEDGPSACMTGVEFATLSDEELLERVGELKILARARPLDKQRLVALLQQRGEVVAVTGDGTNDAPALNFAHVGLSMGSGTSVAKDASDITLIDDSFSSIATAVLWGRSLYRNIQRFILFQLTINLVAITVVFFGSIFGTEMPLTVTQILWVNLIMDTFAAMAMASLPPSEEVMHEKPRPREESIISGSMGRTLLWTGALFSTLLLALLGHWYAASPTLTTGQLTGFFTLFVFLQFWNMFNAKGFASKRIALLDWRGCRTFFCVLLLIGFGQFAIVEWGGELFRVEPLSLRQWGEIVGATSLVAFVGELLRYLRRR